jgi:CRISPR system Cascade subunit CasA
MIETPAAFNLWHDPWLPIRTTGPDTRQRAPDLRVGFADLFGLADRIEAIALGPAPAESALMRVLVTIAARLTGLDDPAASLEDWQERQFAVLDERRFDSGSIAKYGMAHEGRFGLYDPVRPWMQSPALADECPKQAGVGKLVIGRAAGNNHSWFSHDQDDRPQAASATESVASLLTWLYYGPSGKLSARRIHGRNASTSKAGPLRSTLSYFPWIEGDLFATLVAAIPWPGPDIDPKADLTPWERPEPIEPDRFPGLVCGPRSAMTARAQHAVLLAPDERGSATASAWISLAHTEIVPSGGFADPYTITQNSMAGNRYERRADASRALWRDLDALLTLEPTGSAEVRRPPVFATALVAAPSLRIRALGFDQDGQVADRQFVTAMTPLLLEPERFTETSDAIGQVGDMRANGETAGRRLDMAVKTAWKHFVDAKSLEDCAWSRDAAAAYWPRAETEFWSRIAKGEYLGTRQAFTSIAAGIFDEITERCGISSRGMKAAEDARIWLYGGPKRTSGSTRRQPTEGNTRMDEPTTAVKDWLETDRAIVRALIDLTGHRPARKALRQGLRRVPEDTPGMHRHLIPVLEAHGKGSYRASYAIAAMIATPSEPPRPTPQGHRARDFGTIMAQAVAAGQLSEASADTRLKQLTRLDQAGLIRQLPSATGRAATVMTIEDWAQLHADLNWWDQRRKTTAMRWLRSFWRERYRAGLTQARFDDTDEPDTTDPGNSE